MTVNRTNLALFENDCRGVVSLLMGVCILVLGMVMSVAFDTARLMNASSKVRAALDSAALAAAKALDDESLNNNDVRSIAETYFNSFASGFAVDGLSVSNFKTSIDRHNYAVETEAEMRIDSYFLRLAKLSPVVQSSPQSKAVHVTRKVDVALVLDVTGSMCSPCDKLNALKDAAKEMVDTLFAQNPTAGAIKVSLVPYAAAVNVGGFNSTTIASDPSPDDCVLERDGAETYTNALPTNGNRFETIVNAPDAGSAGYSCPASPIVPLTDLSVLADRQNFKAMIDQLLTGGWTAGHLGLAWGWYTVSPEWNSIWPSKSNAREYRSENIKAIVLMTDGMFNRSYRNGGTSLSAAQQLDPDVPGSSGYQALQLCQNIHNHQGANGPTIYSVAFQAPPDAIGLLQECVGADNAYTAENHSGLTAAFTNIVEKLSSVRVAQ